MTEKWKVCWNSAVERMLPKRAGALLAIDLGASYIWPTFDG
jgi:hypothetical protein